MADRYWLQIARPWSFSHTIAGFSALADAVQAVLYTRDYHCPPQCTILHEGAIVWRSHGDDGMPAEPIEAFAARHGIFIYVAADRGPE